MDTVNIVRLSGTLEHVSVKSGKNGEYCMFKVKAGQSYIPFISFDAAVCDTVRYAAGTECDVTGTVGTYKPQNEEYWRVQLKATKITLGTKLPPPGPPSEEDIPF